MSKAKKGFFWHVHHEVLLEWSHDIDERVAYVKSKKPKKEVKTRLRLMRPVKGELPKEVCETRDAYDKALKALCKVSTAYDKARYAYGEAMQARAKAWVLGEACKAYFEARNTVCKASKAYDKAGEACDKTGEAFDKALKRNLPAISRLHKKECPGCPWDGKTIFPSA